MPNAVPRYRRILLKQGGEAFRGSHDILDWTAVQMVAGQIKSAKALGIDIAVVVGGGNIWRGRAASDVGMDRSQADYMGMLATVMNAMALQDALEKIDVPTRVQSAIPMASVAEPYIRRRAIRHLEKGRVVIFAAGTGNPFVSTDTAGALRALEIEADVLLMTKFGVDGIYDADPRRNPLAKKLTQLSYIEFINRDLGVMDKTAITLCGEHHLPIIVFDLPGDDNLRRIVMGEEGIGTLVAEEAQLVG
ncbi:MAG TPA: UMP kinase [Chloroflexota bacterium]|nr:UMP kinase [Chloroflexota bacterium]